MTAYVRRAGAGTLADGSQLIWSVADGRRGRRWHATTQVDGAITHDLLLEVDVAGRPSRLELTTPAGMLTLHPGEGSRVLHGNVVSATGVRHLSLPWSEEHGLEVEGRPMTAAVTAHRLAASVAVGEGRTVPVARVDAALEVAETVRRFERLGGGEWRIDGVPGEDGTTVLRIDERGIPILPGDAREWPLELD